MTVDYTWGFIFGKLLITVAWLVLSIYTLRLACKRKQDGWIVALVLSLALGLLVNMIPALLLPLAYLIKCGGKLKKRRQCKKEE